MVESLDLQEIDRRIEESVLPKEGEDPLDDDTKVMMQKKTRFQIFTQMFYVDPDEKKRKKKDSKLNSRPISQEEPKKEEVKAKEEPKKEEVKKGKESVKMVEEAHKVDVIESNYKALESE